MDAALPTEEAFAALVDELATAPDGCDRLLPLLHEDHPAYAERGAATVVQMRGWVLVGLARTRVSDAALLYILEELDAGIDPYLVATAARALRSYPVRRSSFAPYLIRAIANIRSRDDPVSYAAYADYAASAAAATPVRELLATLAWLGPQARAVLPDVEQLRSQPNGLPARLHQTIGETIDAIRGDGPSPADADCCDLPAGLGARLRRRRRGRVDLEAIRFEDHDGLTLTFDDLFRGVPSIVVFFYTRCDNPLKCSLTVSKLARVQALLEARGLAAAVRVTAITYDPEFDTADRLRLYAERRGMALGGLVRVVRAIGGADHLRRHFALGVNFVGSLVNRHRIEAYIVDANGEIAEIFQRLRWDEGALVDAAAGVLTAGDRTAGRDEPHDDRPAAASPMAATGVAASTALALLPKCPICWAAYASSLGIAGVSYTPWLQPLLAVVMVVNLASVAIRSRATGQLAPLALASAGTAAVLASRMLEGWNAAAAAGAVAIAVGSLLSVIGPARISFALRRLRLAR